MFSTDSTRTLIGPADPCRGVPEPEFRLPATALIDRAEASTADVRVPAPRRRTGRFVLATTAAATAFAAAGVAVVLVPHGIDTSRGPQASTNAPVTSEDHVLTPVAFTITANPPSAGDELRALAKRIKDAPYDARTGRYAYVRTRNWGGAQMSSADRKYSLGYTDETEEWNAVDRPSVQSMTFLPYYEFPDEASREYYKNTPPPDGTPTMVTHPRAAGALPTSRAGLAKLLRATDDIDTTGRAVAGVYSRFALARANRAMVLDILADVPGFRWRGEVTDRAGRQGVAISAEGPSRRDVLIFDPTTGALLASEHVVLNAPEPMLSSYTVFLEYDRKDDAPDAPVLPGPDTPEPTSVPSPEPSFR